MSISPSAPQPMTNDLMVDSIASQLYRVLRDRITSGFYPPGDRLDPQAVAREFGVSRTPVRDAIAQLDHDQLVETRPRSGTFVARPGIRDVHEVCQLRKGIEWVATGVAAATMPLSKIADLRAEAEEAIVALRNGDFEPFFHSDMRLHREIVAETRNERMMKARGSVEPFIAWLRVLGATGPHRAEGSSARHLQILDAMAARDVVAAREAAAIHLDEVEEWTTEDMRNSAPD